MAPRSSLLAWKIPWAEEPDRDTTEQLSTQNFKNDRFKNRKHNS